MSSLLSSYSNSKITLMSVYPVNWIPGSLNGCLPFFSVQNNTLYLRADDPNIYGINFAGGLTTLPSVYYGTDTSPVRVGNKGRNFYSAPWAIPTLPAKDTGKPSSTDAESSESKSGGAKFMGAKKAATTDTESLTVSAESGSAKPKGGLFGAWASKSSSASAPAEQSTAQAETVQAPRTARSLFGAR